MDTIYTIQEIKRHLQDSNIYEVCLGSNLSLPTVMALKKGELVNPNLNTLRKVSKYIDDTL